MVATHATTVMIRVDGRERRYDSLTAAAAPVRDLCAKILEAERRLDGELQEDRIELGRRLIDLRAAFVRERGSEHGWRGFLSGVLPTLHHKKAQRCMSLAGWDSGRSAPAPQTAPEKSGTACPTLEDRNASGASGEGWNASGADGEDDDDLPPEADERFTVEGDDSNVSEVEQWPARVAHNHQVAGSSPALAIPSPDTPLLMRGSAGAPATETPPGRTPTLGHAHNQTAVRATGGAAAVQLSLAGEYEEAARHGRQVVGLIERGELSPDQVRRFDAFARGLLAEGRAA